MQSAPGYLGIEEDSSKVMVLVAGGAREIHEVAAVGVVHAGTRLCHACRAGLLRQQQAAHATENFARTVHCGCAAMRMNALH